MGDDVLHPAAEAWCAWKKHCAAGRCREEHANLLRAFGAARFATFVKRYASSIGHHGDHLRLAEINDGWHLLETHACVENNRAGKRYKDWLFERADMLGGEFLPAVESGATLLMRDVVREHLRAEHAPAFMTSLNKPVGNDGFTLEELLPDHMDPAGEIAEREWNELAIRHAAELFSALDKRQHLAVWARARGVAFSNPRLRRMARCTQDLLHKTYQRLLTELGATIKKAYPDETPSAHTRLACMIHARLAETAHEKYFVQIAPSRSFSKV